MKIPKTLLARGMKYKVIPYLDPILYQNEEVSGLFRPQEKELLIDLNQSETEVVITLLHEFFHAVWHETNLDDESVPSWIEHMIICAIARDLIINRKAIIELLSND